MSGKMSENCKKNIQTQNQGSDSRATYISILRAMTPAQNEAVTRNGMAT